MTDKTLADIASALDPMREMREMRDALDPMRGVREALDPMREMREALDPMRGVREALDPMREMREALDPMRGVREALAGFQRWPNDIRESLKQIQSQTMSRRLIEDLERWRGLNDPSSIVAEQMARLKSDAIEAIRKAVLPTHSIGEMLAKQNEGFKETLDLVRRVMPPNYESWAQYFSALGTAEALRATLVAAAVVDIPKSYTQSDDTNQQLSFVGAVLSAAQPTGPESRASRAFVREHWLELVALALTILIFFHDKHDSDATEQRLLNPINEMRTEQVEQAKQLDRIYDALEQLRALQPNRHVGQQFVVLGGAVRVRARPEGKVVAIINQNQVVTVLDKRGRWLKVRYYDHADERNVEGWARKDLFRQAQVEDPA